MKSNSIIASSAAEATNASAEVFLLGLIAGSRGLRWDRTVFVVTFAASSWLPRRKAYLSLDAALEAVTAATERGDEAELALCHLVPANAEAESTGLAADDYAFAVVAPDGADEYPIGVYLTLPAARFAVKQAKRRGRQVRPVFCHLARYGGRPGSNVGRTIANFADAA